MGSKEWGESRWLWARDPTSLSLGLTCGMGLRTLRALEGHTEVNRALYKSKLPPSPQTLPGAGCGTPELWPARHGDPDQGSQSRRAYLRDRGFCTPTPSFCLPVGLTTCQRVGESLWAGALSGGAAGGQKGSGAPVLTLTLTGCVTWARQLATLSLGLQTGDNSISLMGWLGD